MLPPEIITLFELCMCSLSLGGHFAALFGNPQYTGVKTYAWTARFIVGDRKAAMRHSFKNGGLL